MHRYLLPAIVLAALFASTVPAADEKNNTVYLDELNVALSTCGWQSTRKNRSVGGNRLTLGGKEYARGIGTHAPGEFRVKLDGTAVRLTALAGIDAESGNRGSAEFIVRAGKKVLWKSGVMRGGQKPRRVDVDLAGVTDLTLVVTVGGDNYAHDHTDWVDAKIEYAGKKPRAMKASGALDDFPDLAGVAALETGPEMVRKDCDKQYEATARLNPGSYRFPPEQVLNRHAMVLKEDSGPLAVGIRRCEALIEKLANAKDAPDLGAVQKKLAEITAADPASDEEKRSLYRKLRTITRRAVFANPLLDFDDILFIARGVLNDHQRRKSEYDGDHFCDQYYGHNGRTGGGLFILKDFKSATPGIVNVTKGLTVPSGTNAGKPLDEGTFAAPDLSWDGKTIVFAWSGGGRKKWQPENRFNLFTVNVDGTRLTRLTDGDDDDLDPCWMPGGRIVFMTTRRCGYGRCHGRPVPSFTMFSIKPDGSDMITIDYHETNEFHPSVDNRGRLVYTRWDYVDRDHSAAHHMWHCYPDGRDPRSYHANYALPLSTVKKQNYPRGLHLRPWAEFNCRAVPGIQNRFTATAGPHHGQAFGSLVLIDIGIPDDNRMSQVKRITPAVRFPEAETGTRHWKDMAYGTAWPFSEDFYLCNYKDGICVLDAMGNRELLCRSLIGLRLLDPIPLRARPKPPIIPTATFQGERLALEHPPATICVMNVYITDEYGKLPEKAKIKQLRVVQVLPKATPRANNPRIGFGNQSLARIPLGAVPVEEDGSVYFTAPVGRAIYFQLLDERGMAVQSMRSVTYVHPGEQMSCTGCHEDKWVSPKVTATPLALRRPPSALQPEVPNHVMFNFHKNVKPILDEKCASCHKTMKNAGPTDMAYKKLRKYLFYFGHGYRNYLHGGSRVKPGEFGARFSGMGRALLSDSHRKRMRDGKFTRQNRRTIALWLDLNSNELSAYFAVAAQKKGEVVWPKHDVDPDNYTGVERVGKKPPAAVTRKQNPLNTSAVGEKETRFSQIKEVEAGDFIQIADGD